MKILPSDDPPVINIEKCVLDLYAKGKTLEVRPLDSQMVQIRQGQRICLASGSSRISAFVAAVRKYESLSLVLEEEPAEKIAPGRSKLEIQRFFEEQYPPVALCRGMFVLELEYLENLP